MHLTEKEAIIEGLLFAAGAVVKTSTLISIIDEKELEIDKLMQSINGKFEEENRAIMIRKINDGYQMCTKSEYHKYISKLFDTK